MKKFLLTLAILGLLCAPAMAAVHDFSKFSMDVADGWTASEDGGVAILLAPNNEASFSIVLEATGGASAEDIAKAMSKELGGSAPQKDADGDYAFTFERNGNTSQCMLMTDDESYMMFTITDPTGKHSATIGQMASTMQQK